jgi:hypothetical protein
MYTYEVMIRATITKSVVVDAASEEEAIEEAHSMFDVQCDGYDERYEQDDIGTKLIK